MRHRIWKRPMANAAAATSRAAWLVCTTLICAILALGGSPASAGEASARKDHGVMSEWMMFQFRHPGPAPALSDVEKRFAFAAGDVDREAGVSVTDPQEGLYVVMVRPSAVAKIERSLARAPKDPAVGVFGNPRIEPFGPPK